MGEAKRTIIVHAFEDENADGGVGFSMSGYGVRNGEIKCSKDKARGNGMGQNDSHDVTFELADHTELELRFPDDPADAMWVSPNDSDCPKTAVHQDSVICATNVLDDGERLQVTNTNKEKKRYKFALNFLTKDGETKQYDPVWNNQNGGNR